MRSHIWACAVMLLVGPADAGDIRDIGIVRLTGNVWAEGQRVNIEGRAMVCGLSGDGSSLSVRAAPKIKARVVRKLLPLAIVELTGETDKSRTWAKITGFRREVSPRQGRSLPKTDQKAVQVSGWVHTDYLCTYFY